MFIKIILCFFMSLSILSSNAYAAISITKSSIGSDYKYEWNEDEDYLLRFIEESSESTFKFAEDSYFKGQKYREYIIKKARDHNLPDEIFALAGIESAYQVNARSRSGAIGMWQFMRPTAIDVGLVKGKVDNRRDWKKSTDAAMAYLAYLRDDHFYGDLELSVLAYNAGLGKVKRAIEKNQSVDVWVLIKDKEIFKQESIDYLPKFIAYFNLYKILDEAEMGKVNLNVAKR